MGIIKAIWRVIVKLEHELSHKRPRVDDPQLRDETISSLDTLEVVK